MEIKDVKPRDFIVINDSLSESLGNDPSVIGSTTYPVKRLADSEKDGSQVLIVEELDDELKFVEVKISPSDVLMVIAFDDIKFNRGDFITLTEEGGDILTNEPSNINENLYYEWQIVVVQSRVKGNIYLGRLNNDDNLFNFDASFIKSKIEK